MVIALIFYRCEEFKEKYLTEGPISAPDDLEAGVVLMEVREMGHKVTLL